MVLCISLLIVQLFLASITFSFLTVRQRNRNKQQEKLAPSPSFENAIEEAIAGTSAANSGDVDDAFPMHPRYTPKCQAMTSHPRFDTLIAQTVVLNTIVMAMNHYDMDQGLELFTTICEVVFMLVYSGEAALKICAVGFAPYWALKLNKLDFFIVLTSWGGMFIKFFGTKEEAQVLLAFRLLRVLRIVSCPIVVRFVRLCPISAVPDSQAGAVLRSSCSSE